VSETPASSDAGAAPSAPGETVADPGAAEHDPPVTQAAPEAPAGPSGGKRRWVAVVSVAVALTVLAGGGAFWWVRTAEQRSLARTQAAAAAIDKQLDETWTQMEELDRKWATTEAGGDPTDLAPLVTETTTTIAGLLTAVKEASATAASIEHTQVAAAYGAVMVRLNTILAMNSEVNSDGDLDLTLFGMSRRIEELTAQGDEKLNASIRDCNSQKFGPGKTDATAAKNAYAEALSVARQYQTLDHSGEFDYTLWTAELVKYADMQLTLAKLGGKVSSYNAQIVKLKQQQAKINAIDVSFIRESTLWQDVKGQNGQLVYMLRPARKEWDAAKELVRSGAF
jgi:CII-binding regulator of phage lambda lysogenization HflD